MPDPDSEIGFAQLGLGSVLKQNQLVVPPYQREYAWELKYVRTLLQDFAREIGEGDRTYFLGTVVTIPRTPGVLELVDGQQRLATTTIILACIRDYLRQTEPELAESVETEFLTVFHRQSRTRIPRLRLNLDDNEYFRLKLSGSAPIPVATKVSHRFLEEAFAEAARQIKTVVSGFDVREHSNVLNRWIDFIESRASVILLRVPNAANAYRMFETLNDRGKRPSQSDLVKNYLFACSGNRLSEVQQRWAFMRGALESMEDEDTTILFLRHALTAIRGFVREADVYEAVQKHAKGEQPAVTFSNQLEILANAFVAINNPEHERWNRHPDATRRALEVLNLLGINVMKPLLLSIAHRFSEKEIERAFTFCVSLAVRLMISNRTRTGTVEEGLAEAGYQVFNENIGTTKELHGHIRTLVPSDGQFRPIFELATVSNRKLARYYLRSLEMAAKGESAPWHIPNDDRSVINLEHILPEKPEENWQQFSDDEVKLYRNRIGNLALLRASDNSDLRSTSFKDKKVIYGSCPYLLTSQITQADDWTAENIAERQKTLADLALKAWSI